MYVLINTIECLHNLRLHFMEAVFVDFIKLTMIGYQHNFPSVFNEIALTEYHPNEIFQNTLIQVLPESEVMSKHSIRNKIVCI